MSPTFVIVLYTLHALGAVIWVGGLFFAHQALRPAAMALDPPQRLPLMADALGRFFRWVALAIAALLVSGYAMLFGVMGGFAGAGIAVHIMHLTGLVMVAIYLHVYFAPYRRLKNAVAAQDWPVAGRNLAQIRGFVTVNMPLGLVTVAIGASGRFWGM